MPTSWRSAAATSSSAASVLKPGKVALISGGGSGHEPLHGGLRRPRHARCRLPRPGLHLADARPDDGGRRRGRYRRRLPVHRQELRRRRDELRDGRRDVGGRRRRSSPTTTSPSRIRLYTTGRRGVAGTLVVEKIVGAAAEEGCDLAALKALGDRVNARDPLDGRGADLAAPCRPPASRPSRSATARWSSASASMASPAAAATRSPRPTRSPRRSARPSPATSAHAAQGQRAALRQRLRRHAARWSSTSCTTAPGRMLESSGVTHRRARWSAPTSPRSTWPAARSR